jgi:hypothetical protein
MQADGNNMRSRDLLFASLISLATLALAGAAWAGGGEKRPQLSGEAATEIALSSVLLSGTVNPKGEPTTYFFEYGQSSAYGAQTPQTSAGKSKTGQQVSVTVAGLVASTTYHYRLVAKNKEGTTRGPDYSFTTLASPDPGTDPGPDPNPGSDPGGTSPGPEAPPISIDEPAMPQLGSSVVAAPGRGSLLVRRPGAPGFVALGAGAKLPLGSEIDARAGVLTLTSALPSGKTQTGSFGGGRFKISQGRRGYIDLYLRGRACAPAPRTRPGAVATVAAAARRKPAPRLWGRDHGGRFRTHGRNSHATVRGTRWVVLETCKGTLTRVTKGAVVVTDTVRNKRHLVKAGDHYLAKPRHRG